jgi:hypothetical protein
VPVCTLIKGQGLHVRKVILDFIECSISLRVPSKNKGRAIPILPINLPIRCGCEDPEIKSLGLGSWRVLSEFISSDRGCSTRRWKYYLGFGLHHM